MSSHPKLKLTYFGGRGRAEISRLVLAQAGISYEDHRIEGKDWGELKPKTPWGQLPILEVDGKTTIGQSGTIARYIARIGGIGGSSPLESAQIESIYDAVSDLGAQFGKQRWGSEEDKKTHAEENAKTHFPHWATLFENHLKQNNEGKGYFVGSGITLADIAVFQVFFEIQNSNKDVLKDHPILAAHHERVGSSERIAAWIKKRPQTAS